LEKMPLPISGTGAGIRGVQQARTAVIVKRSYRKFIRSLAVCRLHSTITAPSVYHLG